MGYGDMIYGLRSRKGLTQHEVALKSQAGLSQPQISQLERWSKGYGPRAHTKIEHLLALGEARRDEKTPHYCLVDADSKGRIKLLFDADGTLGVYRNRDAAHLALRILNFAGVLLHAAPVWTEYAAREALRPDSKGERGSLMLVDRDESPSEVVRAITDHALSVLAKVQADAEREETEPAPVDADEAVEALVESLLARAR